jgi:protein-tyrosine phosphatase
MRVLMVCLGNICRSPIAEGVLRHKAKQQGLHWEIASAGTESYHIGSAPHRFSQKVCKENGVDISMQRAREFSPVDLTRYDKVYAMSDDVYNEIARMSGRRADMSKVDLFMNESMPGSNVSVPDPYYGPEQGFTPVYEMIARNCDAIVEKYKNR